MEIEKVEDFNFDDMEVEELARQGDWFVYRVQDIRPYILIWDSCTGEGLTILEEEGEFHLFKDLMAKLIENLGDCRGAEISSEVLEGGLIKQRCQNCGSTWTVN